MPSAARQLRPDLPDIALPAEPAWSGEAHGPVGAMHRILEERLLAGADTMMVLPGRARPGEALTQSISRMTGWAVLGACFAAAALLLL